ncbi:hypothetical protein PTKIN_Ptkin01aG0383900 [Pterospermum kingtungense]
MFYPFLCGAFHHQEDDDELGHSQVSTPRKSRGKKDTKNPYSTRGLDQFSALLAELEEKKQQIYSRMGSQGVVRFVYKNSNECVPIVIKLKDKEEEKNKDHELDQLRYVSQARDKLPTPSESDKKTEKTTKKKKCFSWNAKLQNLRRPSCYIPAVIILILLFLVFFGRSFAIICTCIVWYIVPTISGEGSNLRTSMKKKAYVKKLSGNKLVSGKLSSPKSHKFGATKD